MAISSEGRKRVAWLIDGHLAEDYDEAMFDDRWEQEFAKLSSPEELFLLASESHPALSPTEWRRFLDSPLCDMGTALLVFWRNSPMYYYREEIVDERDQVGYELVQEIERKYAVSAYPSAVVQFDPAAFKGLSFLIEDSLNELSRVPAHMYRPSDGKVVPQLADEDFMWDDMFRL